MGRLATPDDALFAALIEIEGLRDSVTHPDGRRAQFVSFHDQNRVDALNDAWDRIEALRAQLAEQAEPRAFHQSTVIGAQLS